MASGAFGAIGNIGNQAADASFKAQDWRNQQAEERLKLLTQGINLQSLQEKLRQSKQPGSLGRMQLPNGKVVEIIQDPATGAITTQEIYGGPDPKAMQGGVDELIGSIDDEEGKKAAKAIYDGTLASTGDPQQAMSALTTWVKTISGSDIKAQQSTDEKMQLVQDRLAEGQKLGLTGGDLTAYAMGLTAATGYSITPGGQRALRPPTSTAMPSLGDQDIAELAKAASKDASMMPTDARDKIKVLQYMAKNGMAPANKIPAAAEAKAKQGQVVISKGDEIESKYLQDKDVLAWLGPVKGRIANVALATNVPAKMLGMNQQTFDKLKALHTAIATYLNLQPALHGARGKAMVDEFRKAVPDFTAPADAWIAQIDEMSAQAQNFIDVVEPGEPGGSDSGGANVPPPPAGFVPDK